MNRGDKMRINKYFKRIVFVITIIVVSSLLIVGCSQKDKINSNTIKLATKPMPEQFILSEILKLLIEENTDLDVEITKGVGGGTSNIHPALLNGDFDMYPEYTGTAWLFTLKETTMPKDDVLYEQLVKKYNEKYDLSWCGLYGFNNTFGIAVRKDVAEMYNLKTYSDLSKYSEQLIFGAEYDFYERDDGYNTLCDTYDLKFKKTADIDIGLKYESINSKKIDVMNVFTTDGQLSDSDVILLEDNKGLYETYYCGTVVRNDVLNRYPELKDVLMKMNNLISSSEIAELNYKLEAKNIPEEVIAKEFLQMKGLLKNGESNDS